jgi:DNA-binding transcriptional LysR family regulator
MEIYQLRTFVAVAQQGHLTQAAEQLHLSQPAVTAQIKALEEEVGLPLFERTAGGVMLTLAGQELLPRAQAVLLGARQILDHARGLKSQLSGRASIGITLEPQMLRLGPWVACLSQNYPLLDLRLQFGITGEVLNQVRKKELDGGFYLGSNPYANVHSLYLGHVAFVLAMPAGWQSVHGLPAGKALGKLPWVGLSQFSSLNRITSELWRELNISPRKVVECDHLDALVQLVIAGVGLALVREDQGLALQATGHLQVLPSIRKEVALHFVYPADMIGDPVLAVLLDTLQSVWNLPAS